MGSYTNFFADALIAEAELDARIVGIHAAMGGGTGMNRFEKRFHDRTFDVGIAEQASSGSMGTCAIATTMQTCTDMDFLILAPASQHLRTASKGGLPCWFLLRLCFECS